MSKIVVAAFYADPVGVPSRFAEFLPFISASRRALSITNPEAEYVVLTDANTSKLLDENGINNCVAAATHLPLMRKVIYAQRTFVWMLRNGSEALDLLVLPDVDCLANRSLEDAIPKEVGLAITHRGAKFSYKINNLAYVRDLELAEWFLRRASNILRDWPAERQEWYGDQEAWQAALVMTNPRYIEPDVNIPYDFDDLGDDHLIARSNGHNVHLYPCVTHNCIMSNDGNLRPDRRDAYMIHFKGDRKQYLDRWMLERFGKSDGTLGSPR